MLGILGMEGSNSLQFSLNSHSLLLLEYIGVLEFVLHHHVHIVRGQGATAKLNIPLVFFNVLRQRGHFTLLRLLVLYSLLLTKGLIAS